MRRLSFPPWLLRTTQAVVGLGLLVLLWRVADGAEAVRILSEAEPLWLAAAFLALTGQTVLSALRWRLTAGQLGISIGPGQALREYYLSQIVNQSIPGGVIGDAGRAVRSRGQAGFIAAGQAVVFERLAGQLALFLTFALAFLATLAIPGGLDWPDWLLGPVTALVLVGAALPLALFGVTRLPGSLAWRCASLLRTLALALCSRRVLLRQVFLSLGTTACNLAAFAFCALAIGTALPVVAVLTLVPLILFTMLIPVSISGWGLREGAAAVLFPVMGATASEGLATSVAFGLICIVSVLPGILPLWGRSGPLAEIP